MARGYEPLFDPPLTRVPDVPALVKGVALAAALGAAACGGPAQTNDQHTTPIEVEPPMMPPPDETNEPPMVAPQPPPMVVAPQPPMVVVAPQPPMVVVAPQPPMVVAPQPPMVRRPPQPAPVLPRRVDPRDLRVAPQPNDDKPGRRRR